MIPSAILIPISSAGLVSLHTRITFSPSSVASRTESLEKHTTPVAAPGLAGTPFPRSFNSFEGFVEATLCINDSTNEVGTDATAFFFTSSVFIDLAFSTKSISQSRVCSFSIITTMELSEMTSIQQVHLSKHGLDASNLAL